MKLGMQEGARGEAGRHQGVVAPGGSLVEGSGGEWSMGAEVTRGRGAEGSGHCGVVITRPEPEPPAML